MTASSKLNPVTLAILKGRLEQIADEMDSTLFRSAFNPIIAEAHDASHGIYDAKTGETLIQGKKGLPIFVGVMAFAVKAVIAKAAAQGGANEGDMWIFNDPYLGGTHLSDFRLVMPVFRQGEVFCYLASVGHWHDVGGNVPGNYNPAARESFQEGMLIPPVKLYKAGEFQQDVLDILSANSRLPLSLYGDLHGQINAQELGKKRVNELLDEYGENVVSACFQQLTERASILMRKEIEQLPDGTFSAEDFLDNDGINDEPLKIALDLTIKGDKMIMDFSRSSLACLGPVNISRATTIAACYVALKHFYTETPANGGVLEPIEFIIPEDSLLSVQAPKPVGGYTETILRMIDVVFQLLAELQPELAMGCAYGTINALSLSGYRKNGARWVMFSFFGGGHGGFAGGDGLNHGNAPISMATIPPLEILEAAYPIKFVEWSLRQDSGGAGQYRGGLGAIYGIELLEEQADLFLFGERGRFAPAGVVGGEAGACNRFSYQQGSEFLNPKHASKLLDVSIKKGEKIQLETPGGGGYGDVKQRETAAIEDDIAKGYISASQAKIQYGYGGGAK